MKRLSIHEVLMQTALLFAQRSTCVRVKAGAVVTVDNRIVSTGYNGNAPGKEHCYDHFIKQYKEIPQETRNSLFPTFEDYLNHWSFKEIHHNWAIEHELHAEMNAIIYCAKKGISINGGSIYTTYSPCLFCVKSILHAGIKHVYYHTLYDREEGHKAIDILKENDITVQQI